MSMVQAPGLPSPNHSMVSAAFRSGEISEFPNLFLTNRYPRIINSTVPFPRGALAIVTNVGWDAVDAEVPLTNGADAYGEIVWA